MTETPEGLNHLPDDPIVLEEALETCARLVGRYQWMRPTQQLCGRIAARFSWIERSEQVITDIQELQNACVKRAHSAEEARLYVAERFMSIIGLQELYSGPYYEPRLSEDTYHEQMRRVLLAFQSLTQSIWERRQDQSPQAKYGEAKLSARRALGKNHDQGLDDFRGIVEFLKERCCQQVFEYTENEVRPKPDDSNDAHPMGFYEVIHMLARDKENPEDVPNPPARVLTALTRKQLRRLALDRERWMPPTPEQINRTKDPRSIESKVTTKVDLERGLAESGLSPDQTRLIEAKIDGLRLQESGAPEVLGWTPKKLASERRSLAPDRPAGKRLQKRFADYARPRYAPRPEDKEKEKSEDLS